MSDPEIDAMSTVSTALASLDEDARARVLRWAAERFGVNPSAARPIMGDGKDSAGSLASGRKIDVEDFEHFAELFAQADPKSAVEKALVAAYWVQVHEGIDQWQSRRINSELKDLGHAIGNITDALTSSMNKKPQLIIQLKKSGSARQATKVYKVSAAGIDYVEKMLNGGSS